MTCDAILLFDRDVTLGGFEGIVRRLEDIGAFFLIREAVFVSDGLSVDVQCPENCWEEFEDTISNMQGVSIDWETMTEEYGNDCEEVDL